MSSEGGEIDTAMNADDTSLGPRTEEFEPEQKPTTGDVFAGKQAVASEAIGPLSACRSPHDGAPGACEPRVGKVRLEGGAVDAGPGGSA